MGAVKFWREWAGARPAPTVVNADGFAAQRGWATGGIDSTPATRRQRGMVLTGGVAGGPPPHKGGPEGPTAQRQGSGARGQRPRLSRCSGTRIGFRSVDNRGARNFTPNLDYTPVQSERCTVPRLGLHIQLVERPWISQKFKAMTFDVFGTVVDWRGSIIREGEDIWTGKGVLT